MRKLVLLLLLFASSRLFAQQFSLDNVKYQTVFPEDLCKTLKEHPGYLLLDVRSKGEFEDTSRSQSLNIGAFQPATHININELAGRWREIDAYKDKPVFIYCSHSQRSRRASKMLADSGFTKIYNINGGMTRILTIRNELASCFREMYKTNTPYKLVTSAEVAEKAKKSNPWFILDVRPDSVFRGIHTQERRNAAGRFADAKNILSSQVEANLASIPNDKPILVVDEFGNESRETAEFLLNMGFKDVSVLFNGMDAWLSFMLDGHTTSALLWTNHSVYRIIKPDGFHALMTKEKDVTVIDLRPSDQFGNQSKNYWENIGTIKNAVNIPHTELDNKTGDWPVSKNSPVVLYTFSNQPEVFEAAKKLRAKGYTNLYIIYSGIWGIRWSAFNIKGKSHLADWVVGVPEENR